MRVNTCFAAHDGMKINRNLHIKYLLKKLIGWCVGEKPNYFAYHEHYITFVLAYPLCYLLAS